jgi:hypothetical protein
MEQTKKEPVRVQKATTLTHTYGKHTNHFVVFFVASDTSASEVCFGFYFCEDSERQTGRKGLAVISRREVGKKRKEPKAVVLSSHSLGVTMNNDKDGLFVEEDGFIFAVPRKPKDPVKKVPHSSSSGDQIGDVLKSDVFVQANLKVQEQLRVLRRAGIIPREEHFTAVEAERIISSIPLSSEKHTPPSTSEPGHSSDYVFESPTMLPVARIAENLVGFGLVAFANAVASTTFSLEQDESAKCLNYVNVGIINYVSQIRTTLIGEGKWEGSMFRKFVHDERFNVLVNSLLEKSVAFYEMAWSDDAVRSISPLVKETRERIAHGYKGGISVGGFVEGMRDVVAKEAVLRVMNMREALRMYCVIMFREVHTIGLEMGRCELVSNAVTHICNVLIEMTRIVNEHNGLNDHDLVNSIVSDHDERMNRMTISKRKGHKGNNNNNNNTGSESPLA